MLTDFVSIDFVLSFAGMIMVVSLLTQVTKNLFDKWFCNKTKWVVAGWSLFLCIIAAAYKGNFETWKQALETVVIWLINAFVIWLTARKAFEDVKATTGTEE